MAEMRWSWQYDFPPFFTLQPNKDTRLKQLSAWRTMVLEYHKNIKQSLLDVREAHNSPLFHNANINLGKLPVEAIKIILEDLAKTGNAEAIDKPHNRWLIFWKTLEEWGDMVYSWAQGNGLTNAVCTIYELTSGEDTVGEEFHGLETDVLIRALKTLELNKKAELMMFDDNQGVKFF